MGMIVSFALLPEDKITALFYPDIDDDGDSPINVNFEQIGYESKLIIRNATSILFEIFLLLAVVLVCSLLIRCSNAKCLKKLHKSLFWNSLIRLLTESYLELLLTSALNLRFGSWELEYDSHKFSMSLSMVILAVLLVAPLVIFILWWRRHENWTSNEFKDKYGSLLDGVAIEKKKSLTKGRKLAVPVIFFARRLLLTGSIILLHEFVCGQQFLMILVSLVSLSFFVENRPLDS